MIRLVFVVVALLAAVWLVVWSRRSVTGATARAGQRMNIPTASPATFIVCTFSMLRKLAEADGHTSPEEIAKVVDYADQVLQLDRKMKQLALDVFDKAAASPLEMRDYAQKLKQTYPDGVQVFDRMIEILVVVSGADGVLSKAEDALIRSTALFLGLTESGYEGIKSKKLTGVAPIH